jgi:hypothetical protein
MNQTPSNMGGIDSEVFLVGDLQVDVGQQRVTRAGIEITLPNLSFQLLLALIRVAPPGAANLGRGMVFCHPGESRGTGGSGATAKQDC